VTDVQDWVESIGFYEYRDAFYEGSIDGATLLGLTAETIASRLLISAPEHLAVLEMELGELKLRRGLLSGSQRKAHLKAYPAADGWSEKEVRAFLQGVGFAAYANGFERIDGAALLRLSQAELRERMVGAPSEYDADAQALELLTAHLEVLRYRSSRKAADLKAEL